jgi:hypothetical protein
MYNIDWLLKKIDNYNHDVEYFYKNLFYEFYENEDEDKYIELETNYEGIFADQDFEMFTNILGITRVEYSLDCINMWAPGHRVFHCPITIIPNRHGDDLADEAIIHIHKLVEIPF